MYSRILAGLMLAFSVSVSADTSTMNTDLTGMGILENNWVRAGVNGTTGTLGSGNNTSPGLLFDPEGTGTFNSSYDYLTPGSPFDGFSVKIDGVNYTNNNAGNRVGIAGDGNGLTDGENSLSWTGGVTDVFGITNTYSLGASTPFIDINTRITMSTAASDVWFAKFIDPDSQGMPGDSSATDNVLGYGIIPTTNIAFSEATVSRYALGLYTTDTNVTAGVEGWTQEADGYEGTNYTDADGNPVNYGTSDDTIGLSWNWTDVGVGDVLEASYAYVFGPSAFDAAEDAINGGAGGGDTTTTDGWGTLEDVGSATDAAESGGSDPEPADPVYTYDYDSATYTDAITAGSVNIIGTGMIARLDDATGLYTIREGSFAGVLDMTRDSDVAFTGDDGSSGTADVTETFTRSVTGTHYDVMSDYDMDWDTATYTDVGEVNAPGFGWTFADDLTTFSGSATDTGTIARTSIVSTDFTYDRTTETTNADDFADDSGYTDVTYSETTTSVVTDTYDVAVEEEFTRTVTSSAIGTEDTSVARVIDWDNATHTDTGSVALPGVSISASDDLSTRSGSATNTGTISRTSIADTTVTYDYVNTIVIEDDFADDSAYEDTTTTTIGDTQSLEITNALAYEETFERTVAVSVDDTENTDAGRVVDWNNIVGYSDAGDNPEIGDLLLAVSDDFATRTSSGSASSTIERTSVVPTDITYDRVVTTSVFDDFADASAYADTSSVNVDVSTVVDTYNLSYSEQFDRLLEVTVLDVENTDVDRVVDWDNIVAWADEGTVALPGVVVNPANDLLTRSGYNSNTGTIVRTSLVPTTIAYDRLVTTTVSDLFGTSSAYDDVVNQLVEASEVTGTYDLLHDETYDRTVEVFVSDILNNTFVFEELILKESQGMDEGTIDFGVTAPVSTRKDFVETTEILWTVAGQEVYKVTTPTEYTYDRTVDVVVTNDFAETSAYDDQIITDTTESSVSTVYDIITEERRGRIAGVAGVITADVEHGGVILDMNRNLARNQQFGVLGIERLNHTYGAYDGFTNVIKAGGTKAFDNGVFLGVGIHSANNNFNGVTSIANVDTMQLGATATYITDADWRMAFTVQHTDSDVEKLNKPTMQVAKFDDGILLSDRISIPDMPNIVTNPSSTNTSAAYMIKTPGKYLKGIAGMTYGREEYKDTESVVIDGLYHLQDESRKNSYNYATVGAELNIGPARLSALHHTDDVNEVSVRIQRVDDNRAIYLKADRVTTDLGDTNSLRLGVKYTF